MARPVKESRFKAEFLQHNKVVHVSDLDKDNNLEVWLAESFHDCQNDETGLQRELDCTLKTADMGEVWGDTLSYFANSPKAKKQPNIIRDKPNSLSSQLQAMATPEEEIYPRYDEICNIRLVGSVLKTKLHIDFGGEDRYGHGEITDLACKPHPVHPEQTIVALFHIPNDNQKEGEQKNFAVAVINLKQNKVINLYRDKIDEEDASIRIGSGYGLTIDTARYKLAPGVRAFGVRMHIGYSPRCAEGGESDYLTLFVEQKHRLRPVLKNLAMSSWKIIDGTYLCDAAEKEGYTSDSITISLKVAETSTHGWRDLEVIEQHQIEGIDSLTGENKPNTKKHSKLSGKLRFDGKMYSGSSR